MQEKKPSVIVIGAGLIGSMWTIYLAQRGYTVHVYELRDDMRKAGFVGGRSINLAMSKRGWKALKLADIDDLIAKNAISMPGRMMHGLDGELTFQPYGKDNQAIFSVSRGGLNLNLIEKADSFENVHFYFNHKCSKVDFKTNEATFINTNSDEQIRVQADLIFGTDGAFSKVRAAMQKTERFNYSQQYLEHGYKELLIPPLEDGSFRMDKNALHIWPRGQFMLIALPNADGTFTCTLFLPFEGAESFSSLENDEAIMAFFEKYFKDAIPLMPSLLEDFKNNPTSPLATIRCSPWERNGKVLIFGDASHAIVPFYGQGMISGFEDCTILRELTEKYDDNWPVILKAFSDSRPKDANAIADLALRNFIEMRDLVGDERFLLRKKIAKHLSETYPDFIPVYSMVSFSDIPYHIALEESADQDKLFESILAIDNIESNWKGQEVEQVFLDWWTDKKDAYMEWNKS